jgi:DNA-binding transcriptional LysR family regulator
LVTFITVAEEKGFSNAAVKLEFPLQQLVKVSGGLEHHLGLVLLNRTTRSVCLIEIGERT